MKSNSACYLRVAVAAPLRRLFTYLPPPDVPATTINPGQRISVPFGHRRRVGLVVEVTNDCDLPAARLRRAHSLIDSVPLFTREHLELLLWAGEYYQHPLGDALLACLPAALRLGKPATLPETVTWQLHEQRPVDSSDRLRRAPKQAALLALFEQHHPLALDSGALIAAGFRDWRAPLKALLKRGWLIETRRPASISDRIQARQETPLVLNNEQAIALGEIRAGLGGFHTYLLEGVTGSGKTEVYLQAVAEVLGEGRQALILLPEIALTPQLIERFERRFSCTVAVLHSGLNDSERLRAWLLARDGHAGVVLGTRSAVWTPLKQAGLIVVDEEHDTSYKQQDGFRYHARDVAIMRARREQVPIVLGSATPSLESLHNARCGRYHHLHLPRRAGAARKPVLQVLDIRQSRMHGVLSGRFLEQIRDNLNAGRQTLLFLNRRGYAPVLMCHACGWSAECDRCDAPMTWHRSRGILACHHCGREARRPDECPACGSGELIEIGHGTERLAQTLQEVLPDAAVVRIDRDTTRRRGSMQLLLDSVHTGTAQILVGTQMLAKGHHFPDVSLVGILEADGGLFSTDFRALERMAQLIVQVSGRAGRDRHPGTVVLQTHHPDHPLLRTLLEHGYPAFAEAALAERNAIRLPPFNYLALLRAEAAQAIPAERFLTEARRLLEPAGLDLMGPVPAPRPRRAGRQRLQLLIQSAERQRLQQALSPWLLQLEELPASRRVRWSIDVDPQDLS